MKVLNLYAGIGGNRKLWPDEVNGEPVHVVAVELDPQLAAIYQENYPEDTVIVADAHRYLLEHFQEADIDFIWSSPPCPTHSDIRRMNVDRGGCEPKYPDMRLYEEIILLRQWASCPWVVENVKPYYRPLIPAQERGRHLLWSSHPIPEFKNNSPKKQNIKRITGSDTHYGFSIAEKKLTQRKDKVLRNLVDPNLGLHVFHALIYQEQAVLV